MKIAVVGAGPAGLAAAWHLERGGHRVVVLESTGHVGGTAGSRTVAGLTVDLGCHRFDAGMPAWVREEIESLVELRTVPWDDRVRFGERWLPFPLAGRPWRQLPVRGIARTALHGVAASVRHSADEPVSCAEAVRSAVAGPVAERLHDPYARKLWDTEPDRLAGHLAVPLLQEPPSPAEFLYPAGGFGTVVDAMADRISDIRTGIRVVALTDGPGGVRIGLAGGESLQADHVLSTMAVTKTAAMAGLVRPSQVHIDHRALVAVYLVLRRPRYTTVAVHHLPGPRLLPIRVSEPTALRACADDPLDRTVICAEIPCWVGDDVWTAPDDVLGRRVADDLVRAGLPDPGHVGVETARFPAVYPVLTPASADVLATAERALTRAGRVTVLGRQDRSPLDPDHRPFEAGFTAAAAFDRR